MRNIFIAGSENTIAGILGGKYKKKLPINNANQIFKISTDSVFPEKSEGIQVIYVLLT